MSKLLNSKQRKTLEAIFSKPTKSNVAWADIEKLFVALGSDVISKGGSVVTIKFAGRVNTFHRPHPQKESKKWMVEKVRELLVEAGMKS
jgi:HicA toxin of bacterial toxin-antitoxin,